MYRQILGITLWNELIQKSINDYFFEFKTCSHVIHVKRGKIVVTIFDSCKRNSLTMPNLLSIHLNRFGWEISKELRSIFDQGQS